MTCGGSGAESSSTKKFLSWMISHADAAWHLMLLLFIIAVVLPELFYYVGLNYTSFFFVSAEFDRSDAFSNCMIF